MASLLGKKSIRLAKNYTLGYSDVQSKVRNATSSDPQTPSNKQLEEIAELTYRTEDFVEVMEIIDKRLNDKGKNWRHVYKSLTLVDHLLHTGSEDVITYCRNNLHDFKTLREFQFVDERGIDQGASVREKANGITKLITDPTTLRERRRTRSLMQPNSMLTVAANASIQDGYVNENVRRRDTALLNGALMNAPQEDEEEVVLKRAIEESKRITYEKEGGMTSEERDIFRAMELSILDEQKRQASASMPSTSSMAVHPQRPSSNNETFLLVDTSVPEITHTPQLQYTQMQSLTSNLLSPLAQSSQSVLQPQQQYLMTPAVMQPSAVQTLQGGSMYQQQSPPPNFQSQLPAFGSNKPFASSAQSPVNISPLIPMLSPIQTSGVYTAQPLSPTQYCSPIQTSSLSQRHSNLAGVFSNGMNGVGNSSMDTFGNVGQLRYGSAAGAGKKSVFVPGSNNPFADLT